jgi:hypothetical protein
MIFIFLLRIVTIGRLCYKNRVSVRCRGDGKKGKGEKVAVKLGWKE